MTKMETQITLFDRDGFGAREIVEAVGLISAGISFDKWQPLLPFGIREVAGHIGTDVVAALADHYLHPGTDTELDVPVRYLQQAVAFFTWLRMIPTLDAQHDEAGRGRRLGENEHGLTALEQYKDEANILRLAYDALDALVESLDSINPGFWQRSDACRYRSNLLIKSREEFDLYYRIGSSRLFVTLMPIIREVQATELRPVMGQSRFDAVVAGDNHHDMREIASRAVALLTMKKAVERLPVEVLPEGIVQVQQSQPVNSRLRAEKSARDSVAASLEADARRCIERLQDIIAGIDNHDAAVSLPRPLSHSKGFTF